jgi:hypothetical protein
MIRLAARLALDGRRVFGAGLLLPVVAAVVDVLQGGDDCTMHLSMLIPLLSFTSMLVGVALSWEWQRPHDVFLITALTGRRRHLTARAVVCVAFGIVAAILLSPLAARACATAIAGTMVVVVISIGTVAICFVSAGYLVGSLASCPAGVLLGIAVSSILYLDPMGASTHPVLISISAALPLVSHFSPRGLALQFALRRDLAPLLVLYTAVCAAVTWALVAARLGSIDLPARAVRFVIRRAESAAPTERRPEHSARNL